MMATYSYSVLPVVQQVPQSLNSVCMYEAVLYLANRKVLTLLGKNCMLVSDVIVSRTIKSEICVNNCQLSGSVYSRAHK